MLTNDERSSERVSEEVPDHVAAVQTIEKGDKTVLSLRYLKPYFSTEEEEGISLEEEQEHEGGSKSDTVAKSVLSCNEQERATDVSTVPFDNKLLVYQRLEEGEIRLLTLEPGAFTASLSITLHHCQLSESRATYEAVSYLWGDPTRHIVVTCDGAQLKVTSSLNLALRYLRHETQARTLWIDGICINQDDQVERSRQVSLMRTIYPKASQVLIWLGEADKSTDLAFETLGQLRDIYRQGRTSTIRQETAIELRSSGVLSLPGLEAASMLTHRQWFNRCWTFQEVVLSGRAEFVCGDRLFPWEGLHDALNVLDYLRTELHNRAQRNGNASRMAREWYLRSGTRRRRHLPFLSRLLHRTHKLGASDPRDKIFSLLGLVDLRNPTLFQPSYDVSIQDVYIRFTRAIIMEERSLCVLVNREKRGNVHGLPSWVPDWSGLYPSNAIGYESQSYADSFDYTFENTYGVNNGFGQDLVHFTADVDPVLHLRGAWIDQVIETHDLETFSRQLRYLGREGRDWHICPLLRELAEKTGLKEKQLVRGVPLEEALLRTMCAGRWYFTTRRDVRHLDWPSHLTLRKSLSFGSGSHHDVRSYDMKRLPVVVAKEIYGATIPNIFLEKSETAPLRRERHSRRESSTAIPTNLASDDMQKLLRAASLEAARGAEHFASNRFLFFTSRGYIGIGPKTMNHGDSVCTLFGADVPFVLRPTNEHPERFTLLGECYVDGIMDGELFNVSPYKTTIEPAVSGVEIRDFTIV